MKPKFNFLMNQLIINNSFHLLINVEMGKLALSLVSCEMTGTSSW